MSYEPKSLSVQRFIVLSFGEMAVEQVGSADTIFLNRRPNTMRKIMRTIGTIAAVVTTAKQVMNLVQSLRKRR